MLEGRLLIDAHVHPARLDTVKPAWRAWAEQFGQPGWQSVFDRDGRVIPAALDELMDAEGVDHAILLCEYSPKATGIQPVEDLLPLVAHNPERFAFLANINPHLHHPIAGELARQVGLGAVGLKVHPVHGGFSPAGWWYEAAATLALLHDHVWIELSGLPPHRLADYYSRFGLDRLARKFIFGTDWPGVPGIARNARAVAALGLGDEVLAAVLGQNALAVYQPRGPHRASGV